MKENKNLSDEQNISQSTEQVGVEETVREEDKSESFDLRTISREAAELSKEFDKENKLMLDDIKKQEKERLKEEKEREKEEEKAIETSPKRMRSLGVLGYLAVPFVAIGAILCFYLLDGMAITDALMPMVLLTASVCYCFGFYSLFTAFLRAHTKKSRIKSVISTVLALTVAVLLVVFRHEVESYIILAFGGLGVVFAFVYLLTLLLKKSAIKWKAFRIVMCALSFESAVLMIVLFFVTSPVLITITGIFALVSGTLMFAS